MGEVLLLLPVNAFCHFCLHLTEERHETFHGLWNWTRREENIGNICRWEENKGGGRLTGW